MLSANIPSLSVDVLTRGQYDALESPASRDLYLQTGHARPEPGDMDQYGLNSVSALSNHWLRAQLARQYFWCGDVSQNIEYPGGSNVAHVAPFDGILRVYAVATTSAHYVRIYATTVAQYSRSSANGCPNIVITADVMKGEPFRVAYSVSQLCSITLYPSLGSI